MSLAATRQPGLCSSSIHKVRLPRRRSPASYSGQFRTLNAILGMWWRRSALCLCGIGGQDQECERHSTLPWSMCTNAFSCRPCWQIDRTPPWRQYQEDHLMRFRSRPAMKTTYLQAGTRTAGRISRQWESAYSLRLRRPEMTGGCVSQSAVNENVSHSAPPMKIAKNPVSWAGRAYWLAILRLSRWLRLQSECAVVRQYAAGAGRMVS